MNRYFGLEYIDGIMLLVFFPFHILIANYNDKVSIEIGILGLWFGISIKLQYPF
jgi:hypothetical protein